MNEGKRFHAKRAAKQASEHSTRQAAAIEGLKQLQKSIARVGAFASSVRSLEVLLSVLKAEKSPLVEVVGNTLELLKTEAAHEAATMPQRTD